MCGFLSEQERPAADEIDEIELGVQAESKRGGMRVGQGGGEWGS